MSTRGELETRVLRAQDGYQRAEGAGQVAGDSPELTATAVALLGGHRCHLSAAPCRLCTREARMSQRVRRNEFARASSQAGEGG